MYRFIAFLWNGHHVAAAAAAHRMSTALLHSHAGWVSLLSLDGLHVYWIPPKFTLARPYYLGNKGGVVLGQLFSVSGTSSYPNAYDVLDDTAADSIVQTKGQYLTDHFWGRYIAFLKDPAGRYSSVIRDCSGAVECYRTSIDRLAIVFSDLACLDPLPLPQLSVNNTYLAAFILSSQIHTNECALNEVKEVLSGESVEVRPEGTFQTFTWDPRRVCEQPMVTSYAEARELLHLLAGKCISAHASQFKNIMLSLSGGLDSAIVLGCLKRAAKAQAVVCINYFSNTPGDDERVYARRAASDAHVPLVEEPRDFAAVDIDANLLNEPMGALPTIDSLFYPIERAQTEKLVARFDVDAIWTGEGGDHLFLAMPTALTVADYAADHGPTMGLLRAIADASRLTREPYISVMRTALSRNSSQKEHMLSATAADCFLEPAAASNIPPCYLSHTWSKDSLHLPKGKRFQISHLVDILNRNRAIPGVKRGFPYHVLLSQPLIEVCLRTPSYILLQGGRQRALARDTFADFVPKEIATRFDKGQGTSYIANIVRKSEAFLQELLLDGYLAQNGIINPKAMEPYLCQRQTYRGAQLSSLLSCVAAEMWARKWTRASHRAAAA